MTKRGRRSSASLAVVTVAMEARRPPPPRHLTTNQTQVWRDTVASMPGGWFDRVHEPMLVAYCRHVAASARLAAMVEAFQDEWVGEDGGLQRLDKLLGMCERESRAIIMCARSMRLTQQSQMHPRSAGRSVANEPTGPRPWDPL